jgi:cytochrome c-type biogenesis protein CcsB
MNLQWLENFDWTADALASSTRWLRVSNVLCALGVLAAVLSGVRHALLARRPPEQQARNPYAKLALAGLALACAAIFTSVWWRGIEVNHFPSQTMSEVLVMFSLALTVSMLVLHFALGMRRMGPAWAIVDDALIVCVLVGAFMTHEYAQSLPTAQRDLPPALQSYWFAPHLSALIFSYATLAIAGAICLVYFSMRFWSSALQPGVVSTGQRRALVLAACALPLGLWLLSRHSAQALWLGLLGAALLLGGTWLYVRKRGASGVELGRLIAIVAGLTLVPFAHFATVPVFLATGVCFAAIAAASKLPGAATLDGLERKLDEVSYRAFAVGFPFLTAGLFMGAFWAQEAWANYWGWDSKENSALISWLVYVVYIHLRWLGGYRGSKAMAVLVGGALSIFITFQIFGYLPDSQKSLHRYTDDNVQPIEGQQGPSPEESARAARDDAQRTPAADDDARTPRGTSGSAGRGSL